MIRGTSAPYEFEFPCTKDELSWVTIKFWQPENDSFALPITKTKDDCIEIGPNKLLVYLEPHETAVFLDGYKAKLQLRAKCSTTNRVFGCKREDIPVYPMLDDIIEENPELPPANSDGFIILDGKPIIAT